MTLRLTFFHRIRFTFSLLLAALIVFSCQKPMPTEKLEAAFNVHARDNGNAGNASDIEINYSQFGLEQIKKYRAFIVKLEKSEQHDLEYLQNLSESSFLDLGPNEVLPSKGVRLPSDHLDSDGDEIVTGVAYKAAVISMPYDPDTYLPTLAYSEETIVLERNLIVCNFTEQQEYGAGEIAINADGSILMATYDVINDLSPEFEAYSSVLSIADNGEVFSSPQIFAVLGGVTNDKGGQFYICDTRGGKVMTYSSDGNLQPFEITGIDLQEPEGIYINDEGKIYLADRAKGTIFEIERDGSAQPYAQTEQGIRGLTGDKEGNLYATVNTAKGSILKISPDRVVREIAQIPTFVPPNYLPPFKSWLGYIEYHDGLLYVAGTSTNKIYTISLDGQLEVFAGTGLRQIPYGDIKTAEFNRPMGLAFSADGKIMYVSGCEDTYPQHTQASYPSRVYKIELVD